MKLLLRSCLVLGGLGCVFVVGCITDADMPPPSNAAKETTLTFDHIGLGDIIGMSPNAIFDPNGNRNGSGNGNDNGAGNENDNGFGNGNDNGAGNENDNGFGNENDNGAGNENDNGAGNENNNGAGNENDNGAGNENDNGAGNENDNGAGNENDNGGDKCPDGSFQVRAEMFSGGASGRMEYRELNGGCRRFRVRVDDFPSDRVFDVAINDFVVGQITTDRRGRGELIYDSSMKNFPEDFPDIFVGDIGDVGQIVDGVLSLDCFNNNGNCNGG